MNQLKEEFEEEAAESDCGIVDLQEMKKKMEQEQKKKQEKNYKPIDKQLNLLHVFHFLYLPF